MNDQSLFLDTNIYIGYAYDNYYEKYHHECCHVFDKVRGPRHTSLSVKQELGKKKRNRAKLYDALLAHCLSGRQLREFDLKTLKGSELNHAGKLVQAHKEGKKDIEYLRSLERLFTTRLYDAMYNRTEQPFVGYSADAYLKDDLQLLGMHTPDDSILADFFTWALPGIGSCFVTGDGAINDRKTEILSLVADKAQGGCTHLSIAHVRNAVQKFPVP